MRKVYNGYDEKFVTGKELKEMFKDCYLCGKRHHEAVYDLTIPEYLSVLNIKDNKKYRLFVNNFFCKIMRAETDGAIDFFGYTSLQDTIFKDRYIQRKIPNCPQCNKLMIIKFGTYGPFWSCSDYPNCKGSKTILILGNESFFGFRPNRID